MRDSIADGRRRRGVYVACFAIWLAAVAFGVRAASEYDAQPGAPADPPSSWPRASALPRRPDVPTLVAFVHPRCPCSRATLAELNVVMNRMRGRVTADVVFMRPSGVPANWTRTGSWRRAHEIPGATVLADTDGIEAQRFQARTSGQIVLYDRDGRLVFDGGITASRGHEGDNAGRRELLALLAGGTGDHATSRVFGCALFDARVPATQNGS